MTFQAYIHPNENVPDDAREAYQIGREVTREALLVAGANRPITIGRKVLAYAESVAAPLRAKIEALQRALDDSLSGLRYVKANYPDVSGVGFDRCAEYAALLPETDGAAGG